MVGRGSEEERRDGGRRGGYIGGVSGLPPWLRGGGGGKYLRRRRKRGGGRGFGEDGGSGGYVQCDDEALGLRNCAYCVWMGIFLGPTLIARADHFCVGPRAAWTVSFGPTVISLAALMTLLMTSD